MKTRSFKNTIVICASCGKEFTRTSNRQWWCSRNCGEKFKRKIAANYRKANPKYKKKCKGCGIEFETNSKRKMFCLISCKEKFYNDRQKRLQLRTPYRHKQKCGGNWREAIKKARGTCELCGTSGTTKQRDGLCVHHLDGNGEYDGLLPNNSLDNLMVICRSCHKKFHNLSLVFVDGNWGIKGDILKSLCLHFECHAQNVVNENI